MHIVTCAHWAEWRYHTMPCHDAYCIQSLYFDTIHYVSVCASTMFRFIGFTLRLIFSLHFRTPDIPHSFFFMCTGSAMEKLLLSVDIVCVNDRCLSIFFAMILGARSHAIFHWQTGCCIHCFFCRLSLGLSVWPLALAPYPMHVQSDRFLIGRHIKSSGIFCSILSFSFARVNVLGISTNPFSLIGTKQRKNIHGMLQSHELTLTHVFTVVKCHFRQHRGSLICCDLLSEQEKKKISWMNWDVS